MKLNYKGMIITQDLSPNFGTEYFTVLNPRRRDKKGRLLHAHSCSKHGAKRIVDCFWSIKNRGIAKNYALSIRNKALKLDGTYVKMIT